MLGRLRQDGAQRMTIDLTVSRQREGLEGNKSRWNMCAGKIALSESTQFRYSRHDIVTDKANCSERFFICIIRCVVHHDDIVNGGMLAKDVLYPVAKHERREFSRNH